MSNFKKIGLVLAIVLVGIQFIPIKYNLDAEVSTSDFIATNEVPNSIASILKTSCYDCHSNNTNYPWYSKIQPMGMLMQDHIEEGKEELNFSAFGNYSKRRQKSKLKSIISQIKDEEMPLKSYLLMHSDAALDEAKKEELINWLSDLQKKLDQGSQ